MKIKSGIKNLLSSKIVLYTVTITFFLNIIVLLTNNNIWGALIIFLNAGAIYLSKLSKNMIVILGGALLIYYLFLTIGLSFGILKNQYNRGKEGMENKDDMASNTSNKTTGNSGNSGTSSKNKEDEDLKKTIKQINKNAPTSSQGLVMTPLEHSSEPTVNTNDSNVNTDESFEVGRSKKNSKGYNVDYASTIEDAYDELNKILGSDGIKRLTGDTQNLMKQQLQLAESMKSMQPLIAGMTPLMEQAKGLLGNIGDNGNLNELTNMAKKFSSSLNTGAN
jgi:energy-coupling factor transporter transmembrane protein EcfT